MSRFTPLLKIAWLIAKRSGMPRDLRAHFVQTYVRKKVFAWETETLRDERIMQKWDAWDQLITTDCLRQAIGRVEKWYAHDTAIPGMYLYRAKTYQHGTFWFWLHADRDFPIGELENHAQ